MDNIYTSYEMNNIPSGEVNEAAESLVADLGEVKQIRCFVYAPKLDGEDGVIVDYKVEISDDGALWTPISSVITFNNIVNNPVSQEIIFSHYIDTRYLRLIPLRVLQATDNSNSESSTYGVSVFACMQ
jgi:beta-galactosidase